MSRVQLALNVSNLEGAIEFYSIMFGTEPAKVRPGYANFAITDPPLKLVLIEQGASRQQGIHGTLNHLGVEVEQPEDVVAASTRLASQGLDPTEEHETMCCYALQEKVWVEDPDGAPWEVYSVLADAPADSASCSDTDNMCCQIQTQIAESRPACC